MPVGGRLAKFWRIWEQLDSEHLHTGLLLRSGYRIPFLQDPPLSTLPIAFPAYQQGTDKFQTLQLEIASMLSKKAIILLSPPFSPGFYSRLFVAPKASGGWRPVIDLSQLNQYIDCPSFKMETVVSVCQAIQPNEWMCSIDLKDAYFHVPIHRENQHYLRFTFQDRVYQFRALPFGLNTAPRVFTSLVRAMAVHLHRRGLLFHHYLDDWLIRAASPSKLLDDLNTVVRLAVSLGWIINLKKSDLVPSQTTMYLGVKIDTVSYTAMPSQRRVERLQELVRQILESPTAPACRWSSLLGHLASLCGVVPNGRLRTRSIQSNLRQFWKQNDMDKGTPVPVLPETRKDLLWWSSTCHLCTGAQLGVSATPDILLFTDASDEGWGAHIEGHEASGLWDGPTKELHINLKELVAVRLGVLSFLSWLEGQRVLVMTDNTTVVSYLNKQGGTRSEALCNEAVSLLRIAENHHIILTSRHLPGRLNIKADQLSRRSLRLPPTEWSLAPEVCQRLWKLWMRPHVDLFAMEDNAKLEVFIAPFPSPRAWKVDAFAHDWSGLSAYAFPPIPLLRQVLAKVNAEMIPDLILIAPCWPAQGWFVDLLHTLADVPRTLPTWDRLLAQGKPRVFHNNPSLYNLHAWRLSSMPSKRRAFLEKQPFASPERTGLPLGHSTRSNGEDSPLGVVHGKLIRARPLFP